jgi:hypothetical protein
LTFRLIKCEEDALEEEVVLKVVLEVALEVAQDLTSDQTLIIILGHHLFLNHKLYYNQHVLFCRHLYCSLYCHRLYYHIPSQLVFPSRD